MEPTDMPASPYQQSLPQRIVYTAGPPRRDRALLHAVALGLVVLATVMLTWWIVQSESRALEQELGFATHQTSEQLGVLEQDLEALDGRLQDRLRPGVPGASTPPLRTTPSPAPPAPAPRPAPAPEPTPAPTPAPSEPEAGAVASEPPPVIGGSD